MYSLPLEILNEIFKLETCASSLKELRLVCKRFNEAVLPILFRHVEIRYEYPLVNFLQKLRAISSGRHPFKAHARTLTIRDLGPESGFLDTDFDEELVRSYNVHHMKPYQSRAKNIKRLLRLAITSCSRVSTVSWSITDSTSEYWNREVVLGAIKRLPLLASLHLIMRRPYIFLEPFPPLEELVITGLDQLSLPGLPSLLAKSSRTLRRLELGACSYRREDVMSSLIRDEPLRITELRLYGTIFLDKAFIPSLRELQSLHLGTHHPIHSFGTEPVVNDAWRLLKDEQIHLQRVSVREADKSFLEYLQSYSGLKSVALRQNGHSELESEGATLENLLDALSNHSSTLEHLTVYAAYEGKWSFGQSNTPALQKLVNLKSLSLAIVADSSSTVPREFHVRVIDRFSNIISGDDEREFDITTNEYNPSHPVCTILEAASLLPKLDRLEITFSMLPPETPASSIGVDHAIHPTVQIDTHVQMYGPLDSERFKFDVSCENRYYRLTRVGGDGFWYRYAGKVRSTRCR